jgi:hypothetical protein
VLKNRSKRLRTQRQTTELPRILWQDRCVAEIFIDEITTQTWHLHLFRYYDAAYEGREKTSSIFPLAAKRSKNTAYIDVDCSGGGYVGGFSARHGSALRKPSTEARVNFVSARRGRCVLYLAGLGGRGGRRGKWRLSPGSRPSIMQTKRTAFTGIDIQGHQAVVATGSSGTAATRVVPVENLGDAIPADARVAIAMPPRDCVCRWLTTPFASLHKARKVLPTILDIQLPFPLEECVYDFVADRKSDDGHVEALALAARHRAVAGALAQWEAHTVDPAVLDHEGLALWSQSLVEQPVSATQSACGCVRWVRSCLRCAGARRYVH